MLATLVLAAAFAQSPVVFIQGTDTQFGMYTGDKGFEKETANFEQLVAAANRLRPAFVVVTGDLVNKTGDAAEIAEYKRIAATLEPSIPLYNVPGNHDLGNEPTAESLARWRANFGPDYYSFRAGAIAGIVLDTPLLAHPENVPDELRRQREWLERELAKARRDGVGQIIVFQHHPWFVESPDEPDSYHNIPKARRVEYLELLKNYGVTRVFAGHLHKEAVAHWNGIEIVASAPTGKPLGAQGSGYTIVTGTNRKYVEFATARPAGAF